MLKFYGAIFHRFHCQGWEAFCIWVSLFNYIFKQGLTFFCYHQKKPALVCFANETGGVTKNRSRQ